jgi:hypothetical protein
MVLDPNASTICHYSLHIKSSNTLTIHRILAPLLRTATPAHVHYFTRHTF